MDNIQKRSTYYITREPKMSIILQWSKKSPIQVTVTTPFTLVVFAPSPLLVLDDPFQRYQLAKQRKEMWEFTYLMKQYIY
ncbi:hypothetical protein OIU78_006923 [Salix suchowensis]|nr:hypothetical protein OIU78_006923 [Salix suchowensis]